MGATFWAILTSVFALLEIIIPGLITIWLALAALIITIFAGFINNVYIETFIFSILSFVFVLFTRPVLNNYLKKRKKTGFNASMVGTEIKIEKIINTDKSRKEYEVKFKGSIWDAISEDFFKVGDIAVIKDFKGNKIVLAKGKE